jgi:hypothetical protein
MKYIMRFNESKKKRNTFYHMKVENKYDCITGSDKR